MRIDKFLWAVRVFKSRSTASSACEKEKVKLNDQLVKPSKAVHPKDQIAIKCSPIWRTYTVISLVKSRVGPKLVQNHILETTSETELEKLKIVHLQQKQMRIDGFKGRPTKKNKRKLDDFFSQ